MTKDGDRKIRVLLADDHMVVRMGIAAVLSFEGDIDVVGEADTGLDAVKLAHELKPDVVLMDLKMPKLSGAEATAQILADNPAAKVLILTSFTTSVDMKRAMDAGASGALEKSSSRKEIIDAVRAVAGGRQVMNDEIRNTLRNFSSIPALSPRQTEILNLVAKGLSNKEIAEITGVTTETVKFHVTNILQTIGATSRTEAASVAINLGLITG